MTKAQHTPGPWKACKDGDCRCGQIWSKTADQPVATVEIGQWGDAWPALRFSGDGTVVEAYTARSDYGEVSLEEAKANANLIAAAPELLTECEASAIALDEAANLLAGLDLNGCAKIMREQATRSRAASAKARGQ